MTTSESGWDFHLPLPNPSGTSWSPILWLPIQRQECWLPATFSQETDVAFPSSQPVSLESLRQETALNELMAATGQALEGPPGIQSHQNPLLSLSQVCPHQQRKGQANPVKAGSRSQGPEGTFCFLNLSVLGKVPALDSPE